MVCIVEQDYVLSHAEDLTKNDKFHENEKLQAWAWGRRLMKFDELIFNSIEVILKDSWSGSEVVLMKTWRGHVAVLK